jgi:hypothetical protein
MGRRLPVHDGETQVGSPARSHFQLSRNGTRADATSTANCPAPAAHRKHPLLAKWETLTGKPDAGFPRRILP